MTRTTSGTIEHRIGAVGLFALHLASGDVRLRGDDTDTVRIVDEGGTDLEDVFHVERGEGSLSLSVRKGLQIRVGRGRDRTPELDIRVPRRATIVVESSSADVVGSDLDGEQRFHAASGDISLDRVSGTIAIEVVSGDVAMTATGELRTTARTVSGDLEIRAGTLAELRAASTSGDIAIAGELVPGGSHQIETVSGDVLLALAGGARVEVSTVTGDVRADVPHRAERDGGRRVVVVGDGRAALAVRSMSGDVRLAKARGRDIVVSRPGEHAPLEPVAPPEPVPPFEPVPPVTPSEAAIAAAYEEARLGILRMLERGEIDVAEAGRKLEALDAAGIPEDESRV